MSNSENQAYRYNSEYNVIQEILPNGYFVKVFSTTHPINANAETAQPLIRTDSNLQKYQTSIYATSEAAFTEAYGWMDYDFYKVNDPNKNKNLWKEAYNEVKKKQLETYKHQSTSEATLERAYKKGWENKAQLPTNE
jgi:hypothetical protein